MSGCSKKTWAPSFNMYDPNSYANIMLDLECADAKLHNPALIQLGAVYFDLDSGVELDHIDVSINFDSCLAAGLQITRSGMRWLEENIPLCLERSTKSDITLKEAMQFFDVFVKKSIAHARIRQAARDNRVGPQVMVWGNGSVADNIWIHSAYQACGMVKPWEHWNDMCLRTFVRQIEFVTGQFFSGPKGLHREGTLHDALDDCKHQIKYLVAARQSIMKSRDATPTSKDISTPTASRSRNANTQVRRGLQTPETSFSGANVQDEQPFLPTYMTPETSTTIHRERDSTKLPSTLATSDTNGLTDLSPDCTSCIEKKDLPHATFSLYRFLPTPDVSFSIADPEDDATRPLTRSSTSTNYGGDLGDSDFDILQAGLCSNTSPTNKRGSEDIEDENEPKRPCFKSQSNP